VVQCSSTRLYECREAKPRCGMEAVADGHPDGAFYRVAKGGQQTGDEGEW
jgi:hypothetical protein